MACGKQSACASSTPDFPGLHCLLEFAQTRVHGVSDAIQPSFPLSPPSSPALNLSQHQGLFQWVGCLHQVSQVLELPPQYQSFWCIYIQGWQRSLACCSSWGRKEVDMTLWLNNSKLLFFTSIGYRFLPEDKFKCE